MVNISKKTKKIFLVVLLICLSGLFLVACGANDKIHNISTAIPEPRHFMAKFMMAINKKVPNFGLTVIVFTVSLRLILSPFDIWQQIVMKKNNAKMKKMKPELEALQKKFADDKQRYQQEQMALYKREKYSMLGSCLPTIITMIIFFIVFAGFNQTVSYEFAKTYKGADDTYEKVLKETLARDIGENAAENYQSMPKTRENKIRLDRAQNAARRAVREYYGYPEIKPGEKQKFKFIWPHEKKGTPQAKTQFLWIQNIFVSDTWKTPVATYEEVTGQAGNTSGRLTGITKDRYEEVMHDVVGKGGHGRKKQAGKWNGLLILPALTVIVSLLTSILFSPAEPPTVKLKDDEQKKKQQGGLGSGGTMKAMKYIMPLITGVFAVMYSGAFALYMLFSSLFAAVFIQAPFKIATKIEEKKENK